MSEINFKEEEAITQRMRNARQDKKEPAFLGELLIKLSGGYIKDQKQANKILVIITIVLFAYSAYLMITKILV